MCNPDCIRFGREQLLPEDIEGKKVLEVGSRDVNGSLRGDVMKHNPLSYWGVDLVEGKGVDEICNVYDLVKRFGSESFDVVICTEMLEHVQYWQHAILNLKQVLKPGGVLIMTTRSLGCPYHDYPGDYWRYEIEDLYEIFRDLNIVKTEKDPDMPGVFMKAYKPQRFDIRHLDDYKLHSMITGERTKEGDVKYV